MTKQQISMFEQGFITVQMAAEKLGVHVVTIHRMLHSGKMGSHSDDHVFKVGKTTFISRESFSASQTPAVRKALKLDDWSHVEKLIKKVKKS